MKLVRDDRVRNNQHGLCVFLKHFFLRAKKGFLNDKNGSEMLPNAVLRLESLADL